MLRSNQQTQLLRVVANPFFLAIPFTVLVIWFLPNPTSKYQMAFTHQELCEKPNAYQKFYDLNGNGKDEQIIAFHNIVRGEAAIKILDENNITTNNGIFMGI